jgi:hypothetical protein
VSADDLVHEMQEMGAQLRRAEAEQRRRDLAEYRAQVPKRRQAATPERDLQGAVVKWARMVGCMISATVNEQRSISTDPNEQARFYQSRKRAGVVKGWPDLTLCTPEGRVAFVELKAARGRLSQAQIDVHAWLRTHGHVVLVARSVDELADGLAAAGVRVGRGLLRPAVPVEPLRRAGR